MMTNALSPYVGPVPRMAAPPLRIDSMPVEIETLSESKKVAVAGNVSPDSAEGETERVARLAALKPMEYDRIRKEEAKALGVQVKTLDDLVKVARIGNDEAKKSPFTEIELHPDPVDPAALFEEVSDIIRRFIVLDSEQADAAALWVVHTSCRSSASARGACCLDALAGHSSPARRDR